MKETKGELQDRIQALERIVTDIHWMAKRYADGRNTYAPSMFNRAMRIALRLGITLQPDPIDGHLFARDRMGDGYSEITDEDKKQEEELCREFNIVLKGEDE